VKRGAGIPFGKGKGKVPLKGCKKNGGARSRGGCKLWCPGFKDSGAGSKRGINLGRGGAEPG